jgi:hypothetical protein
MIELKNNRLILTFPDVHARLVEHVRLWFDEKVASENSAQKARLFELGPNRFYQNIPYTTAVVSIQRTLRIPDDSKDYPLPPDLGDFPLRHVDDFAVAPESWKKRGGVMLPIQNTEAMWLKFEAAYPMALKVGAGGVCAVSGQPWSESLVFPNQNYVVLPQQPWLDGFRISENVIRQFVATPLGKGMTVEQQLTGTETWGGLQIQAYPMLPECYWHSTLKQEVEATWDSLVGEWEGFDDVRHACRKSYHSGACSNQYLAQPMPAGLGAGGRMRQAIAKDSMGTNAWDLSQISRCFIHLCLSEDWQRLTGEAPPPKTPSASNYTQAGQPWFNYVSKSPSVGGTTPLSPVKTLGEMIKVKTGLGIPDNASCVPLIIRQVRRLVRGF